MLQEREDVLDGRSEALSVKEVQLQHDRTSFDKVWGPTPCDARPSSLEAQPRRDRTGGKG